VVFVEAVWSLYTISVADSPKQNHTSILQMQILAYDSKNLQFHQGSQPRMTKQQKRQKERERERKKKNSFPQRPYQPIRIWRIVPCATEYKFLIDILSGSSFLQKMKSLDTYGSFYFSSKTKSALFPNYKPDPKLLADIQKRKQECSKLLLQNQRLRWVLKPFITQWRLKRFRTVNDADFITLSPIENPIHVYNFSNRCQYIFDAKSLLQHVHKRLLHHDGQIPHPLIPMNPFTNEPFTLSQMIGIYSAMRRQGQSVWSLEAFAQSKFQIDQLLSHYRKPLRIHALKSILYDYVDWDGIDLLLNFIEVHHEEHSAQYNKTLYTFFLREMPDEAKIQAWRSLCREFYEEDILAEDTDQRDIAFYRARRKTGPLCAPPHDLVVKRTFFLKSKKDASNRSGTV
jgi:hypothetical protein